MPLGPHDKGNNGKWLFDSGNIYNEKNIKGER